MVNYVTVEKPVRYVGNEWNAVTNKPQARLRFAIAYPDVYEVGMSYLGLQILYGLLNERDWIWCERTFSPWPDLEKTLREEKTLLGTVESGTALKDLHILGFSLQHEMLYTNVLAMLELGGIALLRTARRENDPLVIAGGPCAYNPMPMADFMDAFVIGEGEDVALELCETVDRLRTTGAARQTILEALGHIEGIFVPSLYRTESNRLGETFLYGSLVEGVPDVVQKRLVENFETSYYPTHQVVPNTKVIHHRLALEVMRGCPGGCRFCQAGYTDRPVRERSPMRLMRDAEEGLKNTGFNELGLLSLSTADYTQLPGLCSGLIQEHFPQRIALSLPSLRIDSFPARVAQEIGKVRGTGLTFAPEAGSERLRWAINKLIYDAEIYAKVREAVSSEQDTVKFYFMVGLPTETDEDLQGIADMVINIKRILKEKGNHRATIHVGISPFVPKPHTAYQWYGQISLEEIQRRINYIYTWFKGRTVKVNWHDPLKSLVEGALARGDMRTGAVILRAYRQGARFDEWGEYFSYDLWDEAFRVHELSLTGYAAKTYEENDRLPWDCVSIRVQKRYLWREWEKTFRDKESRHCGNEKCRVCRVCDGDDVITVHADGIIAPRSKYNMEHEMAGNIGEAAQSTVPPPEKKTYRYWFAFQKKGRMIYTSHHDLMMLFESILRRAGIHMAYTEGFHPHPKIIFASPLPLGMETDADYLELSTTEPYDVESIKFHIQNFCPDGIIIQAIGSIPPTGKKITALVQAFRYEVDWKILENHHDRVRRFQETFENPEFRNALNLIETDLQFSGDDSIKLIYTCVVDGGKYTKAEQIKEHLEKTLSVSLRIDKYRRLDIFSRNESGSPQPLCARFCA